MLTRLLHYLTALGVLAVVAGLYQLTVVAWLTPAEVELAPIEAVTVGAGEDPLGRLFPPGAWQRDAKKRLTIPDQGIILFSHREQISPSQWRVWPVTVVMHRDGRPPIMLDAAQGAEVAFAKPLEVLGSGAPPIKSGQLLGDVTIRSLPETPDTPLPPRDRLRISTRDVGIDSRRIWTNEALRMQWGKSVMEGRNLTIRLAGGGAIPTTGGQSPLSILDSMELVYLDRLQIPVPARGRMQPAEPPRAPDGTRTPDGLATIECKGRVTFDFATDLLRLRDEVRIRHQPHTGPADTIDCDAVTIELNNPLAPDLPRETTEDWLESIRATGQPVIMKLPSLAAELVAETIEYRADEGALRVQGGAGVRAAYDGVHIRATDLVYRFHPDDPKLLGRLDCRGSGLIDLSERDGVSVRSMRWSKGVHLLPLDTADHHQLVVDGQVTTRLTDGGRVVAETLRFTFEQLGALSRRLASPEPKSEPVREPQADAQFVPKQAALEGDVLFDTSLLYAETNRLQLFFDQAAGPVQPAADAQGLGLNPASGARRRFWVRQPEDPEENGVQPIARPRPTLFAKQVHARVTMHQREILASDLTVEGDVRLKHQVAMQAATLPLEIRGDSARVISKNGHETLQIEGRQEPARFELGDGYFVGPTIVVSTRDNYVWINEAGELQVPQAWLPRQAPKDRSDRQATTAPIEWRQPPRCRWTGGMTFDGQTVELTGGVALNGQVRFGDEPLPWNLAASAERFQVHLDRGVDIANAATLRQAKLQDITLLGQAEQPVFVTADQLDQDERLQARHVLSGNEFVIQPHRGTLRGPGPGWYRQWTRSSDDSAFAGFVPPGGLMATHLVYQDSLTGDLRGRQLQFNRGVRVGIASVARWDQVIDAAQMESLRAGQATIDCQTLRLAQVADAPVGAGGALANAPQVPLEVEALGGVLFRARNERGLFESRGNRASYASAKDLFIIEGDGRQPATLRQTQPSGQPGMNIALGYLKIRPKTMEIDSELQSASPGVLPPAWRVPGDPAKRPPLRW